MRCTLALLVCIAQSGWGIPPAVQCAKGTYAAASSCAVSLSAVGAGHLLVGTIGLNAVTIADVTGVVTTGGAGNTLVHDVGADATGTAKANELYYKCNSNSGDTTMTFSLSTPLTGDCFACEFSGAALSNCLDTSNAVNSGTTGSPENGAAITPTNSGDVVVVSLMPETTVTSVGGSWAGQFGTNHVGSAYIVPASASAQTPSYSGDSHTASNYCSAGASFFPYTVLPSANLLGVGARL